MAHHHQRDLINNDDATTDRLKLPVHTPPPPHTSVVAAATTTGTMPSPLALPPPAIEPAVSPRDASNQEPFQLQRPDNATPPAGLQEATLSPAPDAAATASSPIAPARCSSCRKRLGLAGFRCRCGSLFCAVHRYSDRHTCTFDYKAQAREAIARDNPAYKAPKLLKI